MATTDRYINERLYHFKIVVGIFQGIELAAWLDVQVPGNHLQVSAGTATVAMVFKEGGIQ